MGYQQFSMLFINTGVTFPIRITSSIEGLSIRQVRLVPRTSSSKSQARFRPWSNHEVAGRGETIEVRLRECI